MPLLASDFGALVLLLVAVSFTVVFVGVAAIIVNSTIARRRWWGLLLAAIPIAMGGYFLFLEISSRGDWTGSFLFGALPLVLGIAAIITWSRPCRP
jgi:hypothetical protein